LYFKENHNSVGALNVDGRRNRCLLTLILLFAFILSAYSQPVETGRTVIPFNEQWQFKKADYNKSINLIKATWENVTIPHTWNAVDMQTSNNFYQGDAFYKKSFTPSTAWKDKRVFIRFEGVGAVADVYINDKWIGVHKGAYSAFCFEITHELKYGEENNIVVKANNESREDVVSVNHNLFGVYGGMYRNVSLIITNKVSFTNTDYASSGVYVRQQNVSSSYADITVTAKLENKWQQAKNIVLETAVYDAKGAQIKNVATPVKVLPQGIQIFHQTFALKKPHLWNAFDDPYLYKVVTSIKEDGAIADKVAVPLGIRKFEIVEGKGFYLNGRPYRLHGVNRHQDWWGYGNALSNQQHAEDLNMIKEMGANTIRLSHYQQAEYIYSKADSMGFIIWTEIPFVNTVSGKEAENAKQQMTELIRQNYNHPSIYVWGLHNEIKASSPDAYGSVLTAALNDIAKTEDPDRYTASVNGSGEMESAENSLADIQGINRYFGWYEKTSYELDNWVKDLKQRFPFYKVVLSEYGCEGNVNQQDENPPTNVNPTQGQYYPEQLETRLHEIQWGIIEKHPYLFASYIWCMFDFAIPGWNRGGVPARNQKGMVTFDRKIKKDVFYWYKANWSKEPVVYISDRRLVKRKNATTNIIAYSNQGTPALFVNGKRVGEPKQGTTSVHFIFENVALQKGKNNIKLLAGNKGKSTSDEVEWTLE
jgi:beta-galactosidase